MPGRRIETKRVYEAPSADDGTRILVDRIWPRGVSKKDAAVALWARELAPSSELRKWFGHDPERWPEFRRRYVAELAGKSDELDRLLQEAGPGPITLVFAAKDTAHNNAVVLREIIQDREDRDSTPPRPQP